MHLSVAARTDVGMIRAGNEDAFFADANEQRGVFIVADGMGGHAAGEVASEMAVQIVTRELSSVTSLMGDEPTARVAAALQLANKAIYERTLAEVDKQGMGTTASVLLLGGARYLIGQVGDSRIYMLRNGVLHQVTKDHSYVQEQVDAGYLTPEQARYHPYSNVITRCVGAGDSVEPDTYAGQVLVGLPLQTLMIAIAHRDLFGLEGALPPVGRGPSPSFQGAPLPSVGCPKCGGANAQGTRFCTACGSPIAG